MAVNVRLSAEFTCLNFLLQSCIIFWIWVKFWEFTHAAASPLTRGWLASMKMNQVPECAISGPVSELGVGSFDRVQLNWSSKRCVMSQNPNSKLHCHGSRTEIFLKNFLKSAFSFQMIPLATNKETLFRRYFSLVRLVCLKFSWIR